MKVKHRNYLFIALIILFYFVIASTGIVTADDFRWATTRGMNRFLSNFDNYNGRYLGNYLIVLISRSKLANIFFQVTINTGIVVLAYNILEKKIDLPILMLFFLTIPNQIYKETYAWMSGFANYNTAIFFTLLIIYLLKKENISYKGLSLLFISGLSVQLFLENVSMVNIIVTTLLLIYSLFNKKYMKRTIVLFLSNLIGTIIMFSNTAYTESDNMRSLSGVDFKILPRSFLTTWGDLFFKNNAMILIFLAIGVLLIANHKSYLKYTLLPIAIYFSLRYQFKVGWEQIPTKLLYLEAVFVIFFIFAVLYLVYKSNVLNTKIKLHFYVLFLLGGFYSTPLLILNRDGNPNIVARNIFSTYILLIIAVLYLYIPLLKNNKEINKVLNKLTELIGISIMIVIGSMSTVNYMANNHRIQKIQDEISDGQLEIEVQRLPFEEVYLYSSVTESNMYTPQFKEYYNIPDHIKLEQVPLKNKFTK